LNAMAVRKSVSELTPTQCTTTTPNTSVNTVAQRGTRGVTVFVIFTLLLPIFTDLMVTRHTQIKKKRGSGIRRTKAPSTTPHTSAPRTFPTYIRCACIPSATRRHEYIAGVCPPVSSNIQNVPNPHVRLHRRSPLLSHTPLELRGACLGLTTSVDPSGQQYRRAHSQP
jgi:hypothetical protein